MKGIIFTGYTFQLLTYFLKRYFEKRLGGITGDIYGAVIELSEITALLVALL